MWFYDARLKYPQFVTEKEVFSLQHTFMFSKQNKEKYRIVEVTNTAVSNRTFLFQNDNENKFRILKFQIYNSRRKLSNFSIKFLGPYLSYATAAIRYTF
jgi:hypothetical protein